MAKELGPQNLEELSRKLQRLENVKAHASRLIEDPGGNEWPQDLQIGSKSGAAFLKTLRIVSQETEIINDDFIPSLDRLTNGLSQTIFLRQPAEDLKTIREFAKNEIIPKELLDRSETEFKRIKTETLEPVSLPSQHVETLAPATTTSIQEGKTREKKRSRKGKEPLLFPDGDLIEVNGKQQRRVVSLLIDAYIKGDESVPNEQLEAEDIAAGVPPKRAHTNLYNRISLIKKWPLNNKPWTVDNLTTQEMKQEGKTGGYTLRKIETTAAPEADSPIGSTTDANGTNATAEILITPDGQKIDLTLLPQSPTDASAEEPYVYTFRDVATAIVEQTGINEHAARSRVQRVLDKHPEIKPKVENLTGNRGASQRMLLTQGQRNILVAEASLVISKNRRPKNASASQSDQSAGSIVVELPPTVEISNIPVDQSRVLAVFPFNPPEFNFSPRQTPAATEDLATTTAEAHTIFADRKAAALPTTPTMRVKPTMETVSRPEARRKIKTKDEVIAAAGLELITKLVAGRTIDISPNIRVTIGHHLPDKTSIPQVFGHNSSTENLNGEVINYLSSVLNKYWIQEAKSTNDVSEEEIKFAGKISSLRGRYRTAREVLQELRTIFRN